jgi:flagellum-specific ATP synthase
MSDHHIEQTISAIEALRDVTIHGEVTRVQGLLVECHGIQQMASIGSRCHIETRTGKSVLAEVVGLAPEAARLMPYESVEGIGIGCQVVLEDEQAVIYPDHSWKGRIINALGEEVDDKGMLIRGKEPYLLKASPPSAHKRVAVGQKMDVGVKAINSFTTCCEGQRMGIFAGSGVGKSMLISMLTRFAQADIKIIGLVGERGREVQEFIHDYLGPEGMKNAIIVAATSDESALMRRQAAYTTMAIAEYFRDQGQNVLCLMDSVTRFAMAQREIGLSAGEPPATKGYTPTVFVELPKLLERAGPGVKGQGSITGLFTVLVEGDDHNEPIADAVRGILDGHIVLDRSIAERGRFPAINILRSVSRMMPQCNTEAENYVVTEARKSMAAYDDMAEMIRIGAYRKGSDVAVDHAIALHPKLEEFLHQKPEESVTMEAGYAALTEIMNGGVVVKPAETDEVTTTN